MIYLIVQTFVLLLIAGLLGLILGWYLTRIAAANARASLQARLRSTEDEKRRLRTELDALTTAKHNCDTERRLLSDELADLRARQEVVENTGESTAQNNAQEADSVAIASAAAEAAQALIAETAAPAMPGDDNAPADNLQQIKGIGPKIAGILEELGVQRYEQIAAWTPEKVNWVNERLKFKGRIEREEWIAQATALIAARDD